MRAAVVVVLAVVLLAPSGGSAAAAATDPVASASGPPPRITTALRRLANSYSRYRLRQREPSWSQRLVRDVAKRVVKKWVKEKAQECRWPLADRFFCERPPRPTWGVGMTLEIGGYWAGTFRSPWDARYYQQLLPPGRNHWLVCWSKGVRVRNAVASSNLWYKLVSGYWVSDSFLDTGTNYPIYGVARCQV